jgi:hypothetical protein
MCLDYCLLKTNTQIAYISFPGSNQHVIRSGRTRKPEYPTIPENSSMRMPSREVRTRVWTGCFNGKFPPSHMHRGHIPSRVFTVQFLIPPCITQDIQLQSLTLKPSFLAIPTNK